MRKNLSFLPDVGGFAQALQSELETRAVAATGQGIEGEGDARPSEHEEEEEEDRNKSTQPPEDPGEKKD